MEHLGKGFAEERKNPCNLPRRARPPTAHEPEVQSALFAATCWLIMEWPAWVSGRHDTGAMCPSCNLAREAATLSLVTRIGSHRCVDPVGETASLLFPSWPTPAVFHSNKVADAMSQRKGCPVSAKAAPKPSRPPHEQAPVMTILTPPAAGIDVHAVMHMVCVPAERLAPLGESTSGELPAHVRRFGVNSCDPRAIADWLKECGVTTVAMESTGVYWIPLFELLEARGFEVWLVEPGQLSRCGARPKTDVLDVQWIQRLHSYGLLQPSFRPAARKKARPPSAASVEWRMRMSSSIPPKVRGAAVAAKSRRRQGQGSTEPAKLTVCAARQERERLPDGT